MELPIYLLFVLFLLCTPFAVQKLMHQTSLHYLLSDVVLCFGLGILLSNTQQWWLPQKDYQLIGQTVAEIGIVASVLLAIPMLLMTSNLKTCFHYAPQFLQSFVLCILAVLIATVFSIYWFPNLEYLAETAGCLVGVYVGGTPNMAAISYAVAAPSELFILLNSTDLFCSGLYFIFLTSVAKPFYQFFLPKTPQTSSTTIEQKETISPQNGLIIQNYSSIFKALGIALVCIALSIGIALLFPNNQGKLNEMLLMIVLSSSSILCALHPKIQSLKGVYELAQYLLLIFALSVGFMADFSKLTEVGLIYLAFNATFVLSLFMVHLLLGIWFKIDTDTFIITSTACIFGPPFIGQVCNTIKNKEMLAPGMALAILGLIIGTYLGIFITAIVNLV